MDPIPDVSELGKYKMNKLHSSSEHVVISEDVERFRHIMLLRGVLLEDRTGLRLTSKAPLCSTIIRREFGFKGRPIQLAEQLFALLVKQRILILNDTPSTTAVKSGSLEVEVGYTQQVS